MSTITLSNSQALTLKVIIKSDFKHFPGYRKDRNRLFRKDLKELAKVYALLNDEQPHSNPKDMRKR